MSPAGQALLCSAPLAALPDRRGGAGRKHADRLMSSLRSISDEQSVDRRVRKFLVSTPKTAALTTLSLLLSDKNSTSLSPQAALSLYRNIKVAPWFTWNATLAASIVPLLDEMGFSAEAEAVILEAESKLRPRELSVFFSDLIEAYARRGMRNRVFEIFSRKMSPGKFLEESMVRALCVLDSPSEAEAVLRRIKPSAFHYRLVVQSYGKMGLFREMVKTFESMISAGIPADTVSFNTIISCYGEKGMLEEIVSWLKRMRDWGIPHSIRTCNSVLNSCPQLLSILRDDKMLPTTLENLVGKLEAREASLVKEIASSKVILEASGWNSSEGKMDLHGYHLSSAFVALLSWVEELERGFQQGGVLIPREIFIVCGSGKHSDKIGESPVKKLVRAALFQMGSPFRVDRKNVGQLVAGGTAVREWILKKDRS